MAGKSEKVQKVLNKGNIKTATDSIKRLTRGLSKDDQVALSKELANLVLTKDTAEREAMKQGKAGKYINQEGEDKRVQRAVSDPTIDRAVQKLVRMIQGYSPQQQVDIAKKISSQILTKKTSRQKATIAARGKDFFNEVKKKSPKEQTPEEQEAKESTAEQLLTKLTNTSQFRLLSSKLSREADEKKRAEIAYKLVKRFPKQSDNFLYTLRAMLK
jgi:hypothetical protein